MGRPGAPSRNLFHGTMERMPMMRTLDLIYSLSPSVGRMLVKLWYRYMTHLDKDAEMVFMNYGYAPIGNDEGRSANDEAGTGTAALKLRLEDEGNRYCIQLYHHVASGVDLKGRDVLEIGCGRGGGASYVARYLGPRSVTGMDLAPNAIEFCRRHHAADCLHFVCGDAVALPFEGASFDAVISIESSHCYSSMREFLSEVRRVLRPGGHLLLADRRDRKGAETLRAQLRRSGFRILSERRITPNILRALDLDNERRMALIHRGVPGLWRKLFKQFAATPGTSMYESFRKGHWEYLSFVLRRDAGGVQARVPARLTSSLLRR
jgi:ubiquinone/menaquinone biosynthesis C-methylase UbiE